MGAAPACGTTPFLSQVADKTQNIEIRQISELPSSIIQLANHRHYVFLLVAAVSRRARMATPQQQVVTCFQVSGDAGTHQKGDLWDTLDSPKEEASTNVFSFKIPRDSFLKPHKLSPFPAHAQRALGEMVRATPGRGCRRLHFVFSWYDLLVLPHLGPFRRRHSALSSSPPCSLGKLRPSTRPSGQVGSTSLTPSSPRHGLASNRTQIRSSIGAPSRTLR